MRTGFSIARTFFALVALGLGASACSNLQQSGARPGDYAANYANAPMSSLYPGNYPQTPAAAISSH